jgi:putative FmdB family regulatory protein
MPIYEYACNNCDHVLDALQKMSDPPLVDCPECGEPALKRLLSAPRFRLKGGGWYETDFKKDNQRNLAKGDSESAKKDTASDSSSKPEKKSEPGSSSGSSSGSSGGSSSGSGSGSSSGSGSDS